MAVQPELIVAAQAGDSKAIALLLARAKPAGLQHSTMTNSALT